MVQGGSKAKQKVVQKTYFSNKKISRQISFLQEHGAGNVAKCDERLKKNDAVEKMVRPSKE